MTNERHEKALEAAEWIQHDGSQMPVPSSEIVQCRFRDGEEEADGFQTAAFWNGMGVDSNWKWGPRKTPDDIIAYRIVSPQHFTNGE